MVPGNNIASPIKEQLPQPIAAVVTVYSANPGSFAIIRIIGLSLVFCKSSLYAEKIK